MQLSDILNNIIQIAEKISFQLEKVNIKIRP